MNLIKLNAIDSTNSFLKQLAALEQLENFTTVVAEHQTQGRGQRGAAWIIEPGKNLTFSVLYTNKKLPFSIFTLNVVVAVSLIEALEQSCSLQFKIKWPNDILAEQKKIAGILIENSIKSQSEFQSIIGVGLNVNQEFFENLPQAASLYQLTHQLFEKEALLHKIIVQLQSNLSQLDSSAETIFWEKYHTFLFKKNVVATFEDPFRNRFLGKIVAVTEAGKLKVVLENDLEMEYDLKEIKLLY